MGAKQHPPSIPNRMRNSLTPGAACWCDALDEIRAAPETNVDAPQDKAPFMPARADAIGGRQVRAIQSLRALQLEGQRAARRRTAVAIATERRTHPPGSRRTASGSEAFSPGFTILLKAFS